MNRVFNCKLCNEYFFYNELVIDNMFFVRYMGVMVVYVNVLVSCFWLKCECWNSFDIKYNS